MLLRKILLAGLATILSACASLGNGTLPTKPVLTIERLPNGGLCMDRDNAGKLGLYILELEAAAAQGVANGQACIR